MSRAPLSLDEVLFAILHTLFDTFEQADRGFVALQGPEPGTLIPKAMKLRRGDSEETIRISRTVVRRAMDRTEAILFATPPDDAPPVGAQGTAETRVRSTMCAPLLDRDCIAFGAVYVETFNQRRPFTQDDLDQLATMMRRAAVVAEKARGTTSTSADAIG